MRKCLVLVLALFSFTLQASVNVSEEVTQGYEKPDCVSQGVWEHVQPDLLPLDHPIKPMLDDMFGSLRVLHNRATFMASGFSYKERSRRRRLISGNRKLPGYLIKTYLDIHPVNREDGLIWKNRINGARQVQACLDRHDFNHIMKVPKKWLYPMPNTPRATGPYPKGFILVVEDAGILDHDSNYAKYASELTQEQMLALYIVLGENNLWDSIFPFNIPFCEDGKIAFIDTEFYNSTERFVEFDRMTKYFPRHLRGYWESLYKKKKK